MFKTVSAQVDLAELENEILKFWKEDKTFEKSITSRPDDKKWNFLDGPPFVTGAPHYGSLLSSMPKDLFGRYWTMKGYQVRRVWGWDGHGLPIENKVENKLGIKRKKDIEEKVGVDRFVKECLEYVNQISSEWEWYVDHIGRWVDFQHAYKTWDLPYMESVMWVFKQIYDKGLIYKGLRVTLYCPHCATPISNFEVAMDTENHKDITELANTYKYPLRGEKATYLLAWSTTPWTKIVTPALAVNPNLDYVKVKQGDEYYILGKETLKMLKEKPSQVIEEFKGEELVGKEFIPHYDYYKIEPGKKAFIVVGGDFVSEDEGTGIVTLAAYGEDDLAVMKKDNIQMVQHLDDEGVIYQDVPKFGGMYYLDANEVVNKDLAERGLLYDEKQYTHTMPHCWRCGTRLYYAPIDAWFVDVQSMKPRLFKNNEGINWFPKHFKNGRFAKSMEAAPDWNISRNRYWGSPVPVWECNECGERIVPGSIKELEDLSGQKITNLHKPDIDRVEIPCPKCGKKAKRVPEVLDSWIEAGSASFAERHFPFEEGVKLDDLFPADFIAEYTGQIRAWFYVIHVITTALYDSPGFKNVLVEGVLLGTDGRKMSKNFGNYPDPKELMQKYGGDALRIYLMGSPVMKGEDINFSNDGVPEVVRGYLLILWNCYKYFVDYANLYEWKKKSMDSDISKLTVLDRWIMAKLEQLKVDIKETFEKYDTLTGVKLLREFVTNDLSTWYIRRSRDRINNNSNPSDRDVALTVLYNVLVTYSKLLAPLAPFISEEIYKNLTQEESVHLAYYPEETTFANPKLVVEMNSVRKLVELGHAQRKEAEIKLRQPLARFTYYLPEKLSEELEKILANELNVKKIEYHKSSDKEVKGEMNTNITPELAAEGQVRDLIRQVQQLRKESGLTLKDRIKITSPFIPQDKNLMEMLLKQTNAAEIISGETLTTEVIS